VTAREEAIGDRHLALGGAADDDLFLVECLVEGISLRRDHVESQHSAESSNDRRATDASLRVPSAEESGMLHCTVARFVLSIAALAAFSLAATERDALWEAARDAQVP
jgi:hypothetical protein